MGVGLRVEWRDYKWFDERMSGRWMYDEDSLSFQIEVVEFQKCQKGPKLQV